MSGDPLIIKEIKDPYDPKKSLKMQFSPKELELCKKDEKFLRSMVLMHKKAYGLPYCNEKFLRQIYDLAAGNESFIELDFEMYYASFMENFLQVPNFDKVPQEQFSALPQNTHDSISNVIIKTDSLLEKMACDDLDPTEVATNRQLLGNCTREKLGLIDYSGSESEFDVCNEDDFEDFFNNMETENEVSKIDQKAAKKTDKKGVPKVNSEWTKEKDKFLLLKYGENQRILEKNARKFYQTLTKLVNSDIRAPGENLFSFADIKSRVAALQKIYRACVKGNEETGKPPVYCENYEEMNQVFHDQAWVMPISLAGQNLDYESPSPPKKCKTEDTLQTLLKYRQTRDTAKNQENAKKASDLAEYRAQKLAILSKLVGKE